MPIHLSIPKNCSESFKDRKKSQSATKSNASEDEWPELGRGYEVTNADEGHNQQCYPHRVM